MFPRRAAGVLAAALAAITLTASSTLANTAHSWWVNGFGFSQIDYTLFCADGTRVTGTSNAATGVRQCTDGSQKLEWTFGAFWYADVQATEAKGISGSGRSRCGANLGGGGTTLALNDTLVFTRENVLEIAVLKVAGAAIPTDRPRSVSELISGGFISSADVAYREDFYGLDGTTKIINRNVQLGGVFTQNNVIVHHYVATAAGVPAASTWALVAIALIVLLAGTLVLMRARGLRGPTLA